MKSVISAVEQGKCVVAVGASTLRDPSVMLAITERPGVPAIALSGPEVSPVQPIGFDSLFRATGQQGGIVVLVEPNQADMPGVQRIGQLLRDGQHKPKVVIIAQQFNAFPFMAALSGLKFEHIKMRYAPFFKDLPDGPAVERPAGLDEALAEKKAKQKKKKAGPDAPRFVFVGRDEETAALTEILGTGGPVVISGARGVGRTQVAEHGIAAANLTRLPDYALGWGSGFDGLIALLAEACAAAGNSALKDAVLAKKAPLELIETARTALAETAGLDGQALVIHDFQIAAGRAGDFFRKSRLEMLIQMLVSNTYPLRIVFISTHQPVLHRESANQNLRRVELSGIKGRFLHEIFAAYHAPEFPRERFGPMNERIHGNPLAARLFAVAVRDRDNGVELTENAKFLAESEPGNTTKLAKHIGRKVEKLKGNLRDALAFVSHLRVPVDGKLLSDLGLSRKDRTKLLSLGLLDMVGTLEEKRYRAHPLVRAALPRRATSDFGVYKEIAYAYGKLAKDSTGVEAVVAAHWSTWAAELGREPRAAFRGEYPNDDAFLDSITGMVRRKDNPRYELAESLLRKCIAANPANSDAHLLLLELYSRANAGKKVVAEATDAALNQAAVPEIFHEVTTNFLRQRNRKGAVATLETAVQVVDQDSRLKARLASLLLRDGRRPEAIELLRSAMENDPMLPDAYGLLGMAKLDEGVDALGEAEELIREAVRLAPEDEVQISRLASLLMDRARIAELDQRDALWEEAHTMLEEQIKGDKHSPHVLLLLAELVRERKGDLERARWFVKKAKKQIDRRSDRRTRVRLEEARIDLAAGELDSAEKNLRDIAEREPSNHQIFATLAELLVARELFVPAHAEYMRARERTSPNSVARLAYETEIARLAERIEAQAVALAAGIEDHGVPAGEEPVVSRGTVIRRRKDVEAEQAAAAPAEPQAEEAVSAEAPVEPQAEEAAGNEAPAE